MNYSLENRRVLTPVDPRTGILRQSGVNRPLTPVRQLVQSVQVANRPATPIKQSVQVVNRPATPIKQPAQLGQLTPSVQSVHTTNKPATPAKIVNQIVNKPAPPVNANKTGGDDAKTKYEPKKYTEEQIREMLADGYIVVLPQLWDHVPIGSHVRYIKKDKGSKLPRGERFKPGGFLRSHFTTDDGKKMILLETKPGGKRGDNGYISFPVAYEDIEELWKKYERNSFIEIYLINNSLAQKKQQIEELNTRVRLLEDILRSVIRK